MVQQLWFVKCHLFDFQIFFGCLSFNHVRGQGVRATNKSKDSRLGANLVAKNFQCFSDERSCGGRINRVDLTANE
jgi:hypothetical protein